MFTLRQYQQKAVQSIFDYFDNNSGNPLVVMPTGTGKSLVIADFIKRVIISYPSQRIMMLTHVKELIAQNMAKLLNLFPSAPVGIYSAGLKRKEATYPITFAGIGSVAKRASTFGHVDLIIIDEAHRLSPKQTTMYAKFILDLKVKNPKLKVIGLTATHYRLGLGLLTNGTLFTDVCCNMTTPQWFRYFIENNYLSPLVVKKTDYELDTSDVKISGGEFVLKQLQLAVDKDGITRMMLDELCKTVKVDNRRKILIFATGVEHCEHICEILQEYGETARTIHSKIPEKERDKNIQDFKDGIYTFAINNNVLTTGFDCPDIDAICIARSTMSPGLWVQILGRGTRPAPGKDNCLVMDFAGNTRRLGTIDNPVIPRKKGAKQGGQAPVKACDKCGCYNHASVKFCTVCGAEFKFNCKIRRTAYADEVMSTSAPVVIEKEVSKVVYSLHKKQFKPNSIKVSYYCGLNLYTEWVCFEHKGYAKKKAHEWWKERSDTPPPQTTNQALQLVEQLQVPKKVRVWINTKHPQVMGVLF